MPRLYDDAARAKRDAQLLQLYLADHSYRAIAARPGVGLSLRGVVKAVRRQLAAGLEPALVAAASPRRTRQHVLATVWVGRRCAALRRC